MALRPTLKELNPELEAALPKPQSGLKGSGVAIQKQIMRAVCDHYGFTMDESMNPVECAQEIERQVIEHHGSPNP